MILDKLRKKEDLTEKECFDAIDEMMKDPDFAAQFLTLMHEKGEVAEEVKGIVKGMQKRMI